MVVNQTKKKTIQKFIAGTSELLDMLIYDKVDNAIIQVLSKSPNLEGIRSRQLYRDTDRYFKDKGIAEFLPEKTRSKGEKKGISEAIFYKHLAKLLKKRMVKKTVSSRYSTKYQLWFVNDINKEYAGLALAFSSIGHGEQLLKESIKTFEELYDEVLEANGHPSPRFQDPEACHLILQLFQDEISYHALMCLHAGIIGVQQNKFSNVARTLASSYRGIMAYLLIASFYLSTFPDINKAVYENMEGFRDHILELKSKKPNSTN